MSPKFLFYFTSILAIALTNVSSSNLMARDQDDFDGYLCSGTKYFPNALLQESAKIARGPRISEDYPQVFKGSAEYQVDRDNLLMWPLPYLGMDPWKGEWVPPFYLLLSDGKPFDVITLTRNNVYKPCQKEKFQQITTVIPEGLSFQCGFRFISSKATLTGATQAREVVISRMSHGRNFYPVSTDEALESGFSGPRSLWPITPHGKFDENARFLNYLALDHNFNVIGAFYYYSNKFHECRVTTVQNLNPSVILPKVSIGTNEILMFKCGLEHIRASTVDRDVKIIASKAKSALPNSNANYLQRYKGEYFKKTRPKSLYLWPGFNQRYFMVVDSLAQVHGLLDHERKKCRLIGNSGIPDSAPRYITPHKSSRPNSSRFRFFRVGKSSTKGKDLSKPS